jgi:hypothetical protein
MARYTTQQLADLRAAIAEGVYQVQSNGRMTTFRSQKEMLELEAIMAAELETATTRVERKYFSFERY